MEGIISQGMDYIFEVILYLINLAMPMERQAYLQTGPYERTPERKDAANGYKPKTVNTLLGPMTFDVPQVWKGDFYPFQLLYSEGVARSAEVTCWRTNAGMKQKRWGQGSGCRLKPRPKSAGD